ncbi:unnamed protein product [Withania somnifera]
MAYQPYNDDDLQELTDDDYRKMKLGDDSWYYRCNDTLPCKPLGFKFDEYPVECMSNKIYPILVSERHPVLCEVIEGLAAMAVQKFFGPDGIERPVKAILEVYAGGLKLFGFYITFKVDNNGNEETFQAEVYITPQGTFHVPHCKHKV